MADRLYISSTLSVIAVNAAGVAVPMGHIQNLTLEKMYETDHVREWGNFRDADILLMGIGGRFSWGRSQSAGIDLVSIGLIPSDANIAQFQPFFLRFIDQISQRQVAGLYRALVTTCSIGADARARLLQNVSGECISVFFESELN